MGRQRTQGNRVAGYAIRTNWINRLSGSIPADNTGPGAYCPDHSTGVKLPDDFVVTPLQYVE
jgi:hypothetical protein